MKKIKLTILPILAILAASSSLSSAYQFYFLENYCGHDGVGEGHLDLSKQPVDYGLMRLTRFHGYRPNMDCWLNVTAPEGKGIVIRVNYVEIYMVGRCEMDRLQFFTVVGDEKIPAGLAICGYGMPRSSLDFEHGALAIHFLSSNWHFHNWRRGFELVFTSYRKPVDTIGNRTVEGDCRNLTVPDGEFECSARPHGKMCIPEHLRCDEMDNCGDFSDESTNRAGCPYRGLSGGAIAGIVLGVLGGFTLLCVCVGCIVTRSTHRQKEHNRVMANRALVQVPSVEMAGGAEPPPMYTNTVTNHSFSNAAFVAPPPYVINAVPSGAPTTAQGAAGTNRDAAVQDTMNGIPSKS